MTIQFFYAKKSKVFQTMKQTFVVSLNRHHSFIQGEIVVIMKLAHSHISIQIREVLSYMYFFFF